MIYNIIKKALISPLNSMLFYFSKSKLKDDSRFRVIIQKRLEVVKTFDLVYVEVVKLV